MPYRWWRSWVKSIFKMQTNAREIPWDGKEPLVPPRSTVWNGARHLHSPSPQGRRRPGGWGVPAGHGACLCGTQRLATRLMIFYHNFFELRTAQNKPQSRRWGTEKKLPHRALLRNGRPVRVLVKITGPNLKESIGVAELKVAPKRTINQNNGCVTQKVLSYQKTEPIKPCCASHWLDLNLGRFRMFRCFLKKSGPICNWRNKICNF